MAYNNKRVPSSGRFSGGGNSSGRSRFGGGGNRGGGGGRRGPKKENIHPSKFIKEAQPVAEQVEYQSTHTFNDFAVSDVLQKNMQKRGFKAPSPIQDQAIPVALEGRDVIGIANTGTGKTIAFAVPVIERLISDRDARVLVMAPTRELAQQIFDEIKTLIHGTDLYIAVLIGGTPMGPQMRDLRRNPRIVIGTPGRIKDHMDRGTLNLTKCNVVVLDEVDRMLDMGFVKDMETILGKISRDRQSFFFSATMDPKVKTLIQKFSQDPLTISVKTGETGDHITQDVVRYTTTEEKIEKLHDILVENRDGKVIIFDETKRGVDRLNKALIERGFSADSIHGEKSQGQRQRALNNFKLHKTNVLVATDVAARGIDVKGVTHVINYATPQSYDDYVHRIGRAGRAGAQGFALTFVEESAFNQRPQRSAPTGGYKRRSPNSRYAPRQSNRK